MNQLFWLDGLPVVPYFRMKILSFYELESLISFGCTSIAVLLDAFFKVHYHGILAWYVAPVRCEEGGTVCFWTSFLSGPGSSDSVAVNRTMLHCTSLKSFEEAKKSFIMCPCRCGKSSSAWSEAGSWLCKFTGTACPSTPHVVSISLSDVHVEKITLHMPIFWLPWRGLGVGRLHRVDPKVTAMALITLILPFFGWEGYYIAYNNIWIQSNWLFSCCWGE